MRRYRKGETFRPPSAAESAASADATEAHRRSPAHPQALSTGGQHVLVKTPAGGIEARDDDTIYWEKCTRCIERYTADEKEIVETDEEVIVFNLLDQSIPGSEYVTTALTECGTRYAFPSSAYRWGKLDDDVAAGETVTVSLWQKTGGGWDGWEEDSEENQTGVSCPPTHAGLPSGCFVQIGKVNGVWVILKPHSLMVTGLLTAALDSEDATMTIDGVTAIIGQPPSGNLTVYNVHGWDGDDDGRVVAVWNGTSEHWEAIQVDCPA